MAHYLKNIDDNVFAMKRNLILLLAVLISAASCMSPRYVSREPSMNAEWTGRSHADIVRCFGAPTREVSNGADGLILVYESFYTTHSSSPFGSGFTTTSKEHRNYKEFSLGADGLCYNVRTNERMQDGEVFNLWNTVSYSFFALSGSMIIINMLRSRFR